MFWIVQEDLYNEYNYDSFLDSLKRMNIDHVLVKPIPFTNTLVDEDQIHIDDTKPIIVSGSMGLVRVARRRGWKPGSFLDEDFEFTQWRDGFGKKHCMNGWGKVSKLRDASFSGSDIFVRPTADNKSFNGTIMNREEFICWRDHYADIEPTDEFQLLHADTEIMLCQPKNISAEYRFFIAGGQILTGSLYSRNRRVLYQECVDAGPIAFINAMIAIYQPAEAFVLDIAYIHGEYKIIEVNNFNSSGYYACDVQKIIDGVEQLTYKYE